MRRPPPPVQLLLTLAVFLSITAIASAQTATGQITGTVRDASGAVMTGVKVVVTNQQTGLTRETKTGNNGDYVVPLLPVGTYLVSAEQAGFKMALHSDVPLTVDQIQRVDMELAPGAVTETVEVQSEALALDTASASVGHTITEKQVTELPLNGRNFLQLLFLGAGAVETTGEQGGMRQGVGNAISIMGARPTSNNFMIDGTANIDTSLGTPAAVLSVDAIQEFKEQTTTYSAEYGFSSNQINLVSKTGTNELHGTGFGFFRNDGWDARNFFDDKTRPAPLLDQKQFGFVVGGPVMVPGYDGRNRTFFLVNYEGTRIDRGATNFYTVPTPEQLSGRFSTPVIDPVTGAPFPNNTIPQSRFSRLAQLAIRNNWFPAPNTSAAQGNYQAVRTFPQVQDQFTVRGDQDLARFGRVFVRYTNTTYENTTAANMIDLGNRVFVQDTNNWQVSHSWPILNTLVNQFRIGRVDARADQHGIACPQGDVDFLAVTGTFTTIPDDQRECPSIGMLGYSGTGGAVNAYTASNQPMWDISNTTTWVRGSHTLNFGVNYRRWWLQRDLATGFLGNYAYNVGFTGNVIADMLLGYYSGVGIFQPAAFSVPGAAGNPREFNFKYFAPYFQDDWRVNSRLTVNLGLRWDYRNVPYETRNRMAWRNVDYAPGGLLVADESLVEGGIVDGAYYQYAGRRSPENPDRFKVFAPRVGLAWRPIGEQTVIRGGYGVFFDSAEGREIDGAADVYPYVSRGNYIQSIGQPTPLQTTDSLFPTRSWPSASPRNRRTRTCSSGPSACSGRFSPEPPWRSTTSARTAPTC
jgi:outer membrane receptor protein involved in Fe transport